MTWTSVQAAPLKLITALWLLRRSRAAARCDYEPLSAICVHAEGLHVTEHDPKPRRQKAYAVAAPGRSRLQA
jgi:hypothetical protein